MKSKLKPFQDFFNERNTFILLIFWVIFLSIAYSSLSILRHVHFDSGGFDLGIFDQSNWLYAHFHLPISSIKEKNLFGDHFNATVPISSILLYVWNDVRILLIFQAVFITISAIPIYFVACFRKLTPFASLILAVMYSLFYGIQYAVYFDWHPIVFATALLAWIIYFYEAKKIKLLFLFVILLLLTQENAGLGLAAVGIIYLFEKSKRRDAVIFIIVGFIVSLAELRLIALFSPDGYQYAPHFSHNPITLFQKYFDSPDKLLVWKYNFSGFGFLPFLSPGAIIATFFDLSQYFLPDKAYPHMITPYFHHRAILAPILALGSLQAVVFLKRYIRPEIVLFTALLIAMFFQFRFHHAINKLSKPIYYQETQWMRDDEEILKLVDPNAPVAAQQNLVPHLSHRREIYLLWPRMTSGKKKCLDKKQCWWLDFSGKPKYLVVDIHSGATVTQLLESQENFSEALDNMQKAGKIKLFKEKNAAKIYKINW